MTDQPEATSQLPPTDGTTARLTRNGGETIEKVEMRLDSPSIRISDLLGEYSFFTLAIPYLLGQFDDSILVDFVESQQSKACDFALYFYQAERPIFDMRTLGQFPGVDLWCRTLWAVRREFAKPLEDFLLSVVIQPPAGLSWKFAVTDLQIQDPRNNREVSHVHVRAYGIRHPASAIFWYQDPRPLSQPQSTPVIRLLGGPAAT